MRPMTVPFTVVMSVRHETAVLVVLLAGEKSMSDWTMPDVHRARRSEGDVGQTKQMEVWVYCGPHCATNAYPTGFHYSVHNTYFNRGGRREQNEPTRSYCQPLGLFHSATIKPSYGKN